MENDNFSPQQSFDLISQVIQDAKSKFEEDGVIYTMWGVLLAFASGTQYYLLTNGYESINYYPYFLMPIGAGISFWYYASKAKKTTGGRNQIAKVISSVWTIVTINFLILGFGLAAKLGIFLIPTILLLMGVALTTSGVGINSKLLQFAGIFTNVSAIICYFLEWQYHPLVTTLVALVAVLIPGLVLMNRHKKKNV